jgi:AcrR family transcriptional regulator
VPPEDESPDVARMVDILWGAEQNRDQRRRPELSIDAIVDAAIRVADAEGLDAVSMQRVAGVLGYTPMALYRYIPGKAQLVDVMYDVAGGLPPDLSAAGREWRGAIEQWANALWDVYQRHPWMLRVQTRTAPIGPNGLAWFEALLQPLSLTGIAHGDMVAVAMFISSAVRDLARIANELVPMGLGYASVLERILDGDRFPTLAAMIAAGSFDADPDRGVKSAVEYGLSRLLDGIENATAIKKPKTTRRESR